MRCTLTIRSNVEEQKLRAPHLCDNVFVTSVSLATKRKGELTMNIKQTLDAKGLACPMPIVRTKKAMDTLQSGDVLEVQVTDKGALADFTAWSAAGGHTIIEQKEEGGVLYFYIQRA